MRRHKKKADWAISSQAPRKRGGGSTTRRSSLKPSVERLRKMYEVDGMTTRQIASKVGIPFRTIIRWLNKAGVMMRKVGQGANHVPLLSADWLRNEYVTLNKSAEKIAKEQKCWPATVIRALRRSGIQVRRTNKGRRFDPEVGRRQSEWLKGRFVGSKNPNWRGDAVKKDHRERSSKRARDWAMAVKDRDGWKCVKCDATEGLHAHHIVSWSRSKALRYELSNGMTLCPTCHQAEHENEFAWYFLGKGKQSKSAGRPSG